MRKNPVVMALRTPVLGKLFRKAVVDRKKDEPSPRSELFGLAQLESHARILAAEHQVDLRPGPERLLQRLRENERVIHRVYLSMVEAADRSDPMSPAVEWLLDNYYLISDQIGITREHLPRGYSRQLPRLRSGRLEGLPRVYSLAYQLISHTDGQMDLETLSAFTRAYQSVSPLRLGELWAVPVMLRLALLENLRRVAQRIAQWREDRELARHWANLFLTAAHQQPQDLIVTLADFVRQDVTISRPFIAELTASLHGQHPALGLVLHWLEQRLAERGQSPEQVQQAESLAQASDQASIGNSITSLRTISNTDWQRFVEEQSVTDAMLRRDPMGAYASMDFRTRDAYRHSVEELARRVGREEHEVAEAVVAMAAARRRDLACDRLQSHVGYFLIDEGRPEFERSLGYVPPLHRRVGRRLARHGFAVYLFLLCTTTALMAAAMAPLVATFTDFRRPWFVWPMGAALAMMLTRPALSLINWLATLFVPPRNLPRMNFAAGIPAEYGTVVAVPALLNSAASVRRLIDSLEIRYLGNRDPHLSYALLTDLADAPEQQLPQDRAMLAAAIRGIRGLNLKYADGDKTIFFLLHRPRQWNDREQTWMGHERKRGKLNEFNRLLRAGSTDGYEVTVGRLDRLRSVRCVITLDADTQLPPGTAWKMVATLAHPLNRPVLNPVTRCVDRGYGVLQPRVAINLESAVRSRFARLFAGEIGIDPYSREVSNVYHDLFARGQYIGKGIYDRDTFDIAVGGRFVENTILSHDLIEGLHARCGFINDVELIEDHPARYLADIGRRHRWIRGDWQIAPWLGPRVRDPSGRRIRNSLDSLARFMILDNLRRSLVPASLLGVLLAGWLAMPVWPVVWWMVVLGIWMMPDVTRALHSIVRKPGKMPWLGHVRHIAGTEGRQLVIVLLQWAFLPYEAVVCLHAIGLVVWRKLVSGRRLLEWQPAHDADKTVTRGRTWAQMWAAPVIAALAAMTVYAVRGPAVLWISPLLLVWFLAPQLAWWLSTAPAPRRSELTPDQVSFLNRMARRTWLYFEELVGSEQHWLPPDNFQEQPEPRLAERTSPTNIGMGLLSTLAAADLGFISVGELLDRTGKTFASLDKLERYRGHFFNWYSTRTLQPLHPRYVSSVDSGNFIASLITLRHGMAEMIDRPIVSPHWHQGLANTAQILLEEAGRAVEEPDQADVVALTDLRKTIEALLATESPHGSLWEIELTLSRWVSSLPDPNVQPQMDPQVVNWLGVLRRQVEEHRNDLLYLAPWLGNGQGDSGGDRVEAALRSLGLELRPVPTLAELAGLHERVERRLREEQTDRSIAQDLDRVIRAIADASERAGQRIIALRELGERCGEMTDADLDFLFDPARKLLSIGFNLDNQKLDPGSYDLLASEARITSFLGIAQDKLPLEHWFMLSRQAAGGPGEPALVSWSGSMFEYLMPLLFLPSFEGTLLHQTCRGAVGRQIRYGQIHDVPWGISESCYNLVNAQKDYQYRAFGVPDLGLKRGLATDLVLAPYASAMALMVAPAQACANLQRMAQLGLVGRYGLYEAVDYTPSRVPSGQPFSIVRCFMAHHHGMSLLSMASVLRGQSMRRRFLTDPEMRSAVILLQERLSAAKGRAARSPASETSAQTPRQGVTREANIRIINSPDSPVPDVHLLSNGQYHVMLTSAGSGYSRWRNMAVTRWREDPTRDCWGTFFYLRDADSGKTWSTTWQPTCQKPDDYQAVFSQGRAEFRCLSQEIEVRTEIAVSTEADLELRRMTITNQSGRIRSLELTSYAEIVLADPRAEASHPVFNSLFIETQIVPDRSAVLCTRRPRSADESPPWAFHTMVVRGPHNGPPASYESDRTRFVGRGRSPANPASVEIPGPLSNTAGAVLDPSVSIRRALRLAPHQSIVVEAIIGLAATREETMAMLDRHHDPRISDRIFDIAWTHSQVLMNQLRITEAQAELFVRLAGSVLYANRRYRATPSVIARNRKGQSALWSFGISGDLPIVLVKIADYPGLDLVRQMIQAHGFWRHKGLRTDMVIWTEAYAGYRHRLLNDVTGLINTSGQSLMLDQPGGIFVRGIDQVPEDDRLLLQSVARLVLSDRGGSLAEQVRRRGRAESEPATLRPAREPPPITKSESQLTQRDLLFFNGLGGFTRDGREYVTVLRPGTSTPAPWANILANEQFGSVVTESGGGYTWFRNAHEFRLTPWCNDPVCDTVGEAVYLRDEETGQFWSATSSPAPGPTPYVCRHGLGYTAWEHTQHRLFTELTAYVAVDAPVKVLILKLNNLSSRDRYLSVTGYCEWVLGDLRAKNAMHVVTQVDPQSGAVFAWNAYAYDFPETVGFLQTSESDHTLTADRTEFLGRNGSHASPAAMRRQRLSNRVGAGLDPCAAIQAYVELPAGQQREVVFVLGAANGEQEARDILHRFSGHDGARQGLEAVWQFWKHLLGGVYVQTPDPSVDFLVNNWLLYQVLACRFWGRSGYYQSGGAFGFRDQLQDAMSFLHECPWLLRKHLLTCAQRQFREGDVQHWWHPPTGRGVRTRISDDYLWLPYAACRYVRGTGDTGVLDESVPFLDGRAPGPGEESCYGMPIVLDERSTLYDHCVRAIRHGMRLGEHGLPLIGFGDWNDGMNHVGKAGRGESVWLAFFLYDVLRRFQWMAELRQDSAFANQCRQWAGQLRQSIETHGWDGQWYRRAYFDDGTPLGSLLSPECRIDLLPQSWAVLSEAGDPQRAQSAMAAVYEQLVDERLGLIRLFTPPFDKTPVDPGYIKGYLPGVRENGGQYTHAAVWAVMAAAALRQPDQAWRLLRLINPIRHGDTKERIACYKVEPYVLAADVYTAAGHEGRGGWTWYTGSASWMYRLLTEDLLGFTLEVDTLSFAPVLPSGWPGYSLHYRFKETMYHIQVSVVGGQTWNVRRVVVDEAEQADHKVHMADDHHDHTVLVEVG